MTEQRNTNSWPYARDRILEALNTTPTNERGKKVKPTLQEVIDYILVIRTQRDFLLEDDNKAIGRLADTLDVNGPADLDALLSLVSDIDERLTKAVESDQSHLAALARALNSDVEPKYTITWDRLIALVDIQTREIKDLKRNAHDIREAHQTTQETALTLHATLREVGSALGLPGGDFTPQMVVGQARKIIADRHDLLMKERDREEHVCATPGPTLSGLIKLHDDNYRRMGAALGTEEEQPTVHDILMACTQLEAQAKAFRESDEARLALVKRVQELEAELATVHDDQEAAERAGHDWAPLMAEALPDEVELQVAENLVRALRAETRIRQLDIELADAMERIEGLADFREEIAQRGRDFLAEYDILTLALAYKWGDKKKNRFIHRLMHGTLLGELEEKYNRRNGIEE